MNDNDKDDDDEDDDDQSGDNEKITIWTHDTKHPDLTLFFNHT